MRRDQSMIGTLYVVATPLGNLEDISQRALRVLREVAVIAAEDTRHSRKLLARYEISTPLTSYWDHVERQKAPHMVGRLLSGDSIALISDAGTPCIADPGYHLVRQAIAAGVPVIPIPGPSMVSAAISASGLASDRFAFEGFVPSRKAARRAFFARFAGEPRTIICFEAGRRLAAALGDLADVLGECDVVVAREVTKLHEEFLRGSAQEILSRLLGAAVRGEVTLLFSPPTAVVERVTEQALRASIRRLRSSGLGLKEIARTLAPQSGWSVREVYKFGVQVEDEGRA